MKELNSTIHGLYFPSNENNDAHYRILHIPPEMCYALSSRDKAPFLMHVEIAFTGKSVYDEDIYAPYQHIHDRKYLYPEPEQGEQGGEEGRQRKVSGEGRRSINIQINAEGIKTDYFDPSRRQTIASSNRMLQDLEAANANASKARAERSKSISGLSSVSHSASVGDLVSLRQENKRHESIKNAFGCARIPSLASACCACRLAVLQCSSIACACYPRPVPRTDARKFGKWTTVLSRHTQHCDDDAHPHDTHIFNTTTLRESWEEKKTRLRAKSMHREDLDDGRDVDWDLKSVIFKGGSIHTHTRASPSSPHVCVYVAPKEMRVTTRVHCLLFIPCFRAHARIRSLTHPSQPTTCPGDDCRQEVLAMQLILLFDQIFKEAKLPLRLRPYSVMVTSAQSGLIETIPNATSIDSLKKAVQGFTSLANFFEDYFGPKGSPAHDLAQRNFVESMAAYSVVCYFLQIKDRHNGNIMLDNEGHIIHIDFGFMFSNSPGESATISFDTRLYLPL